MGPVRGGWRRALASLLVLLLALPVIADDMGPPKSVDEDPFGKACGLSEYPLFLNPDGAWFTCDSSTKLWVDAPGIWATTPWIAITHPRYGCVGDDSEDNTTCFGLVTAACDGGETVFVPEGTFQTSTTFELPPGCSLVGVGAGSIIKAAAGHADYLVEVLNTGGVSNRTTRLSQVTLQLNNTATVGLYIPEVSGYHIDHIWIDGQGTAGSKCIVYNYTQNALTSISEFKDCDYLGWVENGASNNYWLKNEWSRATYAHFWATHTGTGMHGNTIDGDLFERDRDGSSPWCGPEVAIHLEAGRDWSFNNIRVGTPPNENFIRIWGEDSPQLTGGAAGTRSVSFTNLNFNLNVDGGADPCDDPYSEDCASCLTMSEQDWTTDGGLYAQGIYDLSVDGFKSTNGTYREWRQLVGNCSIATATECYDADDCPGSETCDNIARMQVENASWNTTNPHFDTLGVSADLEALDDTGWTAKHFMHVENDTGGGDLVALETTDSSDITLGMKVNSGTDGWYRFKAKTSGAFSLIDVLDGEDRILISGSANGQMALGGNAPQFQFKDFSLTGGTIHGDVQVNCPGSVSNEQCSMYLSTMDDGVLVDGLEMVTDYTASDNYTTSFKTNNGTTIFSIEVTP